MYDAVTHTGNIRRQRARISAAIVMAAMSTAAHAQESRWGVLVGAETDPAGRNQQAWIQRIEREQGDGADAVRDVRSVARRLSVDTQAIERQDLASLALVESHLIRARAHTAQLAEADALTELIAAERRLESLLHLPGSSAFYVEVQTAIGLVAAHAQRIPLAEAAQRRAAVIDPSRGVRAAEAAPSWVERANEISREVATAPLGEIEVTTHPAGARVYLDDNLLGTAPTTLRVTRGVHVLRLETDGYRPFGVLLPVDAGARPAVHVGLERDPVLVALSELTTAAARDDHAEARRALRSLQSLGAPIGSVWLLGASAVRADRALVTRCFVDRCEPSRRLELESTDTPDAIYGQALDPAGLGRDRRARDLAWLNAATAPTAPAMQGTEPSVWWQHWAVWTAAALAVGGGIALGVAATDDPDSQRLRITIEP